MNRRETFDFDKYIRGEVVEWRPNSRAAWRLGHIQAVDAMDVSLPWAVGHNLDADPLRTAKAGEWSWCNDRNVRKHQFMIAEEVDLHEII